MRTVPAIPQPDFACGEAQDYSCTADCPSGSSPTSVDCGAQVQARLRLGDVVISKSCSARPIDATPGSASPGGCNETVNFCNRSDGATGSIIVSANCNPVPTGGGGTEACSTPVDPSNTALNGSECPTPILISTEGGDFPLTGAQDGVLFDLMGRDYFSPQPVQTAWTAAGASVGLLALDRNGDGIINNGQELFGNYTPQPPSPKKNGFLALAEFDKAENGGNGDGIISNQDAVFAQLRLWQDVNHNGLSEPGELQTLPEASIISISLGYSESRRIDRYGNLFRYRAKVRDARGAQTSRWAWDVIFTSR